MARSAVADRVGPVRHPLFARVYVGISRSLERRGRGAHRSQMLADARGRLVEVGCGQGVTFGHYPESVTGVVAVEPEPYLRLGAGCTSTSTSSRAGGRSRRCSAPRILGVATRP